MEPARKRDCSDMWEHFSLIAPDKVSVLAGSFSFLLWKEVLSLVGKLILLQMQTSLH